VSDIVFIAGKSKSDYFKKASKISGGRFVNKKKIRKYTLDGLFQAFFSLSAEDIVDISTFYLQVKGPNKKNFTYRWVLNLRVRLYFARYVSFFNLSNEKYFALWNGYYLADKALVLAGERYGKKPVFFENGLMPRTTTVDVKGINFANSLPRDRAFYRGLEAPVNYRLDCTLVEREPVEKMKKEASITLPQRYIFIPFQVESDTQILIYGGWVRSMRSLYNLLSRVINRVDDQELTFVFKTHPSSRVDYDDLLVNQSPRILFANGNDTEELIANAESVITINSTVGIEALMLSKKVITLGLAFYSIEGLVLHASSETQLVDMIDSLSFWMPDEQLRRNFLWYLHERYLVKGSWRSPDDAHLLSLNDKLQKLTRGG